MDEYIKREAAIAAINKFKGLTRSPAQNDLIWGSVKLVERIPAADVVPAGEMEMLQAEIERLKAENKRLHEENFWLTRGGTGHGER